MLKYMLSLATMYLPLQLPYVGYVCYRHCSHPLLLLPYDYDISYKVLPQKNPVLLRNFSMTAVLHIQKYRIWQFA